MAIFDELKSVGMVLHEAGKIEQYQQILDALHKLLEMQKRIDELETDNRTLREAFEIKDSLIPEGNVYWIKKDDSRDGPFCTCCWDSGRKLVRLHKSEVSGRLDCPKCNTIAKPGAVQVFRPASPLRNPAR